MYNTYPICPICSNSYPGEQQHVCEESRIGIYEDNVQHPKHYTFGKFEVIDVIEDWKLPFHLSNVVKYISRAGKKDPSKEKEDIRKALWYLERYLKTLDNKEG